MIHDDANQFAAVLILIGLALIVSAFYAAKPFKHK